MGENISIMALIISWKTQIAVPMLHPKQLENNNKEKCLSVYIIPSLNSIYLWSTSIWSQDEEGEPVRLLIPAALVLILYYYHTVVEKIPGTPWRPLVQPKELCTIDASSLRINMYIYIIVFWPIGFYTSKDINSVYTYI